MDNVARGEKARRIAHGYVGWSVGAGLIPFPLMDVGSLVVLQVKMLTDIARVYGVPLERERARTLVLSTAGGLAPQGVALAGIPALLKFIPVLGTLLGVAVMPAAAATSTLALAEIFIRHIETHGKAPDRTWPQITHSRTELPTAAKVVDEPAAPAPVEEPNAATPTADSMPPPTAEVVIDQPAVTEQASTDKPTADSAPPTPPATETAATEPEPADDHPAAAANEHDAQSEPEAASDDTTPPDADAEQPTRRRQPSARTRRRSPPTETS